MTQTNQATTSDVVEAPVFDLAGALKVAGTKSALIRQLSSEGKSRSDIAKMMGIRYQHVRNVLTAPVKAKAE